MLSSYPHGITNFVLLYKQNPENCLHFRIQRQRFGLSLFYDDTHFKYFKLPAEITRRCPCISSYMSALTLSAFLLIEILKKTAAVGTRRQK